MGGKFKKGILSRIDIRMIKVVNQGLGHIGRETAKLILNDSNFKIVGAIDPKYNEINLGDLLETSLDVKITDDAEYIFKKTKPDVLVLATCSNFREIIPSLETAIKHKINIVSPAEELFYPEFKYIEEVEYINEFAKKNNVKILGTGVNPGCLMDVFPLHIIKNSDFDDLISINIYRWDDTSERRDSLKIKTGVGLNEEEFYKCSKEKKIGHVGLEISVAYLADKLGFKNYEIGFSREPVTDAESGMVIGLHEFCLVVSEEKQKINLDLKMHLNVKNKNLIEVIGIKNQKQCKEMLEYNNIVNGDIATSRILKDSIIKIIDGYSAGLNKISYIPDPRTLLKK